MPFSIELFLFILLIICGLLVAKERNLFAAAMLTGLFSLTSACLFTLMDAVDVAFTEAAVGAGISTVLVLATLGLTGREENQRPASIFPFIVCLLTGGALAVGLMGMAGHTTATPGTQPTQTQAMATYGSQDAPMYTHAFTKILESEKKAVSELTREHPEPVTCTEETEKDVCTGENEECLAGQCAVRVVGLPNLVTSILGSYRGYDTLGETGVIFAAGVGVMLLLAGRRRETESVETDEDDTGDDSDTDELKATAETEESALEPIETNGDSETESSDAVALVDASEITSDDELEVVATDDTDEKEEQS